MAPVTRTIETELQFPLGVEPSCLQCGCTPGNPCITDLGRCYFMLGKMLCSRCYLGEKPDPDT